MLTSGWVVAAVEIALIAAAWGVNRRTPFAGGPLIVLRVMLGIAALSLLQIVAATMLEVPDSRGLFIALGLGALLAPLVRKWRGGRAGGPFHAQAAHVPAGGWQVRATPRRQPSPVAPGSAWQSATVADIEAMEVNP